MRRRYLYVFSAVLLLTTVWYYFSLPGELFKDPYSTVLLARNNELLSASIARDGQWRFPASDSLPSKFVEALIAFEDKRYFSHPGVDVLAMARATRQNLSAGSVVSGGSTISMQVIRLSRKNKSRTIVEKLIEMILATRLELRYSKTEILNLYASHAPFGGNVVGIEAACWRYFGRSMQELSWGEATFLAVLPNAPSLLHPGKNRTQLLNKRNALLDKLFNAGAFDETTLILAKAEPIPDKPVPLPRMARHAMHRYSNSRSQQHTTIDISLQEQVETLVEKCAEQLRANQVHNAAALVLDTRTGEVLAYAGNIAASSVAGDNSEVDVINSPRSTGSILKPFLFAAMMEEGRVLPTSLLPDIPMFINGFAPKNFTKDYDGAVPADKALVRSLNVPAVYLLREYRYEKFHTLLKELGMTTLLKPADHYGLSLILGGAEGTLWDITGMYASLGRVLLNYFDRPGSNRYSPSDIHSPMLTTQDMIPPTLESSSSISAAAIYQVFNILTEVYRPGEETGWRYFANAKKIAWKTGTSYGFRDGWAVGVTPEYTVGIWVGNADGEGRPGLTGTEAASPLLFSIFSSLPTTTWFQMPLGETENVAVCRQSGYRATSLCSPLDTVVVSRTGLQVPACSHHKLIHLSGDKKHRVSSICYPVSSMINQSWFVLPPVQEYYYREKNISYKLLPSLQPGCAETTTLMEMIYPKQDSKVFIPRDLQGRVGGAIFQLAHNQPNTTVYWHLDGDYIGSTKGIHELPISAHKGRHVLTLVDASGNSLVRSFEVISDM